MTLTPFQTKSVRVRIAHAAILTLPTTPVEIVPAPAAGLVAVPLGYAARAAFTHGAYTNADPNAHLIVTYDGDTVPRFGVPAFLPDGVRWNVGSTGFLNRHDAGRSALRRLSDDLAAFEATALMVKIANASAGNLTGGGSGNIMDFTIWYRLVERPPAVGVFDSGGGRWEVRDGQTTAWPDAYVTTTDGGRTFLIDDEAPGGLTLSIVSSRPTVTYP